ncbi:MAG: hypothetical protein WC338_06325 [Candidatus Ratteibacteria bacterium]
MSMEDLFLSFEKRKKLNQENKRGIARKVLELISTGDEIFLGAGTSVACLGEELAKPGKQFMLKIWTNNLFIVNLWLKEHNQIFSENFVGITAGEISRKNLSVVNVVAPFSQIEKAIIGTPGISARGLSADDMDTVQQIEFLIKRVSRVIILADSSKIGRECTYPTRSMRMIKLDIKKGKKYILVTDRNNDVKPGVTDTISKLQDFGFQVIREG